MITNEEYLQRWEESAPTPVDTMTEEEIKKAQGTRNERRSSLEDVRQRI
jgi:RNA polymerase-binding transcription factor DksA